MIRAPISTLAAGQRGNQQPSGLRWKKRCFQHQIMFKLLISQAWVKKKRGLAKLSNFQPQCNFHFIPKDVVFLLSIPPFRNLRPLPGMSESQLSSSFLFAWDVVETGWYPWYNSPDVCLVCLLFHVFPQVVLTPWNKWWLKLCVCVYPYFSVSWYTLQKLMPWIPLKKLDDCKKSCSFLGMWTLQGLFAC